MLRASGATPSTRLNLGLPSRLLHKLALPEAFLGSHYPPFWHAHIKQFSLKKSTLESLYMLWTPDLYILASVLQHYVLLIPN